ncbi:hypothetical protein B0H16DRAFT_1788153 [Mycena metata]|uniref:Uncharacterized protein n=1 Tax=Mycena metata TaxID=1033252 RepID=A0AAD7HKU8_9AGAR|nr:hypothetical protein B0H16DRAFT_1788153 [Mycena metata]
MQRAHPGFRDATANIHVQRARMPTRANIAPKPLIAGTRMADTRIQKFSSIIHGPNHSSMLVVAPNPGRSPRGMDHNSERYLLLCHRIWSRFQRRTKAGDSPGRHLGRCPRGVIHPIFIPVAHLVGYLVADMSNSERWAHLRGQTAKETEQRLEILNLLEEPDTLDPLTSVQVFQTLALYWVRKRNFRAFQDSLGTASDVSMALYATENVNESLRRVGLRQELIQEGRSALGNIIFIQRIISPTLVPPVQSARRRTMLVPFHRLLETHQYDRFNWNYARAQAALLFEEAQRVVTEWNDCEAGTVVGTEWNERSRRLASEIQAHLRILDTALCTINTANKPHVRIIKTCGIVSLAALAGLHAVLAPFDAVARQKHSSIVDAIASITRTLSPSDYENCDCLEVCWEIASREISEQLPTEKWLRYRENVDLSCLAPPQMTFDWTDSPLFEELVETGLPRNELQEVVGRRASHARVVPGYPPRPKSRINLFSSKREGGEEECMLIQSDREGENIDSAHSSEVDDDHGVNTLLVVHIVDLMSIIQPPPPYDENVGTADIERNESDRRHFFDGSEPGVVSHADWRKYYCGNSARGEKYREHLRKEASGKPERFSSWSRASESR